MMDLERTHLHLLSILLLPLVAAACDDEPTMMAPGSTDGAIVVDFASQPDDWPTDPFLLDSVSVKADTLELGVTYGGGCEEHDFVLVAWGGWLESDPLQVPVFLSHDAHQDPCEALISEVLRFELTPLRNDYRAAYQVDSDTVILRVQDSPDPAGFQPVQYAF